MRELTAADIPALAAGCAVVGTGGGGAAADVVGEVRRVLERLGPVPLVELTELDPATLVLPLSGIGAPTVSLEMPASGREPQLIRAEVERVFGLPVGAVMSSEIGGSNGVLPVGWAAELGLPLVDADGMGRAFPEVQMVACNAAGREVTPIVLADVQGNVATLHPVDADWAEWHARALTVASGGTAVMADYVLPAGELIGAVIEGSVRRALRLGRAVDGAADPVASLRDALDAPLLVRGKLVEVERTTGDGFVRGSVVLQGTGADRGRLLRVEIQNENLAVLEDGLVLASVPDLITLVDAQTATAVATEELRYGQRLVLLGWPCDPLWRTPRGLELTGPAAFGYRFPYVPVEDADRAAL